MQNSRQDDLSSTETDPEVTEVMELVDESIDDHYAKIAGLCVQMPAGSKAGHGGNAKSVF